jgi:hypothetical protein
MTGAAFTQASGKAGHHCRRWRSAPRCRNEDGRQGGRFDSRIGMTQMDRLFPRWTSSWGALARANAHVRSQCRLCGIQQRVDASVQALRFGASASPLDQLDRCSVVGCHGSVYFLAARSYGRQWLTLLSGEDRLSGAAPAANALTLDLVRTGPAA